MLETELSPSESADTEKGGGWMVIMFNNDTNSFDEVIEIVMLATSCDIEEAALETWEADAYGKAPVHFANEDECRRVAKVISSIGVGTSVIREWSD